MWCGLVVDDSANGGWFFFLLGVDSTLGDGYEIGEHLHSFSEIDK